MKNIFVPTDSAKDWKALLADPRLHWKPGKSAMTLALSWEKAGGSFPPEVNSLFVQNEDPLLLGLSILVALPEYKVELPGGGRPSQTDLMVVAGNSAGLAIIAVEGKVDEPFGPTVSDRKKDMSPGQEARIRFLLETLKIDESVADLLRYQLLHRTASAILTAKAFHAAAAVMLVHSFDASSVSRQDYDAFVHALAPDALLDRLVAVPRFESPRLFVGWCEGDEKFRRMKA